MNPPNEPTNAAASRRLFNECLPMPACRDSYNSGRLLPGHSSWEFRRYGEGKSAGDGTTFAYVPGFHIDFIS
jgi:hypothetical protein